MEIHSNGKRFKALLLAAVILLAQLFFPLFSREEAASAGTFSSADISSQPRARPAEKLPGELVPLGHAIGISIFSDGVIVAGLTPVKTEYGSASPASDGGLRTGDVITGINGAEVDSINRLRQLVGESGGEQLDVILSRNGKSLNVRITPAAADGEGFKLGIWARDSIAGIGTMTFFDPSSKVFGALGHGINDSDTGTLIPLSSGEVMMSTITGIRKGEAGKPGELKGDFESSDSLGPLYSNCLTGVYGKTSGKKLGGHGRPVPVAAKNEIKTGPATIFSSIEGQDIKEYNIEILKVYSNAAASDRDMMIRVADEELLSKTGGIVQGMSGSPIIQNGKIIGAVTHVLVNDPKRGYAINVEKMLIDAYYEQ